MQKKLLISLGSLGCLVQGALAQSSLFTTTNDFVGWSGASAVLNTSFYSDAGAVNGLGNTATPGSAGVIGSLQLTLGSGWNGFLAGSAGENSNQAFLSAIDPGAIASWSALSSYGPGTLVAYSGTITFDIYTGNFTSWAQFGLAFNYNGTWGPQWASTSTAFTGADGQTWYHEVVPYSINAVNAGLTYFQIGIGQNADSAMAGKTFYIDNFQVVPEPGTTAALVVGGMSLFLFRRRQR